MSELFCGFCDRVYETVCKLLSLPNWFLINCFLLAEKSGRDCSILKDFAVLIFEQNLVKLPIIKEELILKVQSAVESLSPCRIWNGLR